MDQNELIKERGKSVCVCVCVRERARDREGEAKLKDCVLHCRQLYSYVGLRCCDGRSTFIERYDIISVTNQLILYISI